MARRSRSFNRQRRLHRGVRRLIVVGRLGVKLPSAQQVDGRVDRGAPEVGSRLHDVFDISTPAQHAQEDGLEDVLGVGRTPGDAQRRAEDRLGVALEQLGKPQRGRGSHLNRSFVDLSAQCNHLVRLTYPDARGGPLLHLTSFSRHRPWRGPGRRPLGPSGLATCRGWHSVS